MNEIDLKVIIPSSNTIRNNVQQYANNARDIIKLSLKNIIKTVGVIGCTVDLWSDDYAHLSYIGAVVHFIEVNENNIECKKFIIYLNTIDAVSKTAEAIRTKITNIFNDYELSLDDIKKHVHFTTDRGANIRAALDGPYNRTFCFAHIVNNIVHAICEQEQVRSIVNKIASLVKYVKSSGVS